MKKIPFLRVAPISTSAAITPVMWAIGRKDFARGTDPQDQDPLLPKRKTIFQSRVGSLGKNNQFVAL